MSGVARYKAAGVTTEPSPNIWADCPVLKFITDPGAGVYLWEDFLGRFAANDTQIGPFYLVGTNPDSAVVTDEAYGVVNISGSGAAHDEAYLTSNLLVNEAIKKDSRKRVWFETRLKLDDADADVSIIAGLGESSLLAAEAIADDPTSHPTTSLADYDFIGFMAATDGTNMAGIDTVYHQDGDSGTVTVVEADVLENDGTDNDDTYIRLGFTFDGRSTVTFYVNGVAQDTTLDVDDLTGDKLDDALGIIVGIKDDAGGADDLKVDWIRFAADRVAQGI